MADVAKDGAAAGKLKKGDVLLAVDGTATNGPQDLVEQVRAVPAGTPTELTVRRGGAEQKVTVTTKPAADDPKVSRIGVGIKQASCSRSRSGSSCPAASAGRRAGLMFALAIYDVLTPGSLTGGKVIAGSGEIAPDGTVGPIGGIGQKLPAAQRDGAKLFLVAAAELRGGRGLALRPGEDEAGEGGQARRRDQGRRGLAPGPEGRPAPVHPMNAPDLTRCRCVSSRRTPPRTAGTGPSASSPSSTRPTCSAASRSWQTRSGSSRASADGLTPVEQEPLPPGPASSRCSPRSCGRRTSPGVPRSPSGSVLPPEADALVPDDPQEAQAFAANHPDREEVRIVAAALRGGASACCGSATVTRRRASRSSPAPTWCPSLLMMLHATLDLEESP